MTTLSSLFVSPGSTGPTGSVGGTGSAGATGPTGAGYASIIRTPGATGLANVNTLQEWLKGATYPTLENGSTYKFSFVCKITRSAGTTSHTTSIRMHTTGTVASIVWAVTVTQAQDITSVPSSFANEDVYNDIDVDHSEYGNAIIWSTEMNSIWIEGVVTMGASGAGAVYPEFIFSAAPGGAPVTLVGNFGEWKRLA